ncbi:3-oxoacyl-[acyl-carrier-protein] synthase II/minimal PKS ketosynthase (KS/KS alpha) [Thermosporothrix hazakensis]|jgi:beta-ketoacyl-acyl-carrier-protein synthase II|uniref:3-oxoacyl-[acyl-carrier-protein] synthase II/minimal PKS ketosynthase (KS/KS alpha) n=2 Tax=Thermosporothrix TaxID=768650 RepID=A0A326U4P0_THEHA|nr:beta-ketoacyl-[acyl-carrier-protein] synthase family protein [Thermosporothrix hazakensis]PZW26332.1 3-oxoacyl-[acyl-carrier-protein] synthase II/minimal PKS ketosynthase (KS/KS alpha) [Thermosporothrix hazakensis]BBH90666.1 3-oxoacyl-[acyl-carrier-protein] synthase 2 [Thermosporothrix sp. COM3]GCE48717.1 3-oxoacyl-[acyl-carrier-protein] synthase 2 [Thermosporothrix hazakensis]
MSETTRRVVITGLGVIAPNGNTREAFWQACIQGHSGIRRITRFDASALPVKIAGEVHDFSPMQHGLTPDEVQTLTRPTQFALAAANQALHDATLDTNFCTEERERTGVYVGTAMSFVEEGERLWTHFTNYGRYDNEEVNDALQICITPATLMPDAAAVSIAAHHRFYGPCATIATGCSAGADAIGEAFWLIQEGQADRMLAGGTDAAICPIGLNAFSVIGALSTSYNDRPKEASRPYDQKRDGFIMAEGAAMLLLEERELALARGAHIYAEVLGFASNSNAYHMTSLPEHGEPLQQLLKQALTECALSPADVDYINSHGSSTQPNERAETAAYKAVFGKRAYAIPISATKSMIGHTQGAASAIEAVVTALVLDQQLIPPTLNQEYPDPLCDLDYVPNVARSHPVRIALSHSSGFGGVNSVLVFAQTGEHDEQAK